MITICDTGPLVAYLNRHDPYHSWAAAVMKQTRPPLLTCEAVLTETAYFLRDDGLDIDPLFQLLERDVVRLDFELSTHWPRVRTLMARYDQMDLADASIVVMSELHTRCRVLTVDRNDFGTYRRNDRQTIDFVAPPPGALSRKVSRERRDRLPREREDSACGSGSSGRARSGRWSAACLREPDVTRR